MRSEPTLTVLSLDSNGLALDKTPYLHRQRVPLPEAVAVDETTPGAGGRTDGFGNEYKGHCGV